MKNILIILTFLFLTSCVSTEYVPTESGPTMRYRNPDIYFYNDWGYNRFHFQNRGFYQDPFWRPRRHRMIRHPRFRMRRHYRKNPRQKNRAIPRRKRRTFGR